MIELLGLMVEALPIGPDGIHRAAEEMIAEHGPDALTTAKKRALMCTLDGTDTLPSELQSQYKLEALERRVQELEALERRVQSLEAWALKDLIIEGGPVSSAVFE
jgi:hypothetical protein